MPEKTTPKLCECGCGQPAPIARLTNRAMGYVKGQPVRFRSGHNRSKNVRHDQRQRFERFVHPEPNSGCHLWTGNCNRTGYGVFAYAESAVSPFRQIVAHRVAWMLANGAIPNGLLVLHKCDVRCCVNPDHLFLGTYSDNTMDMVRKGRGKKRDLARGVTRTPGGKFMARIYRRGPSRAESYREFLGEFLTPDAAAAAIQRAAGGAT